MSTPWMLTGVVWGGFVCCKSTTSSLVLFAAAGSSCMKFSIGPDNGWREHNSRGSLIVWHLSEHVLYNFLYVVYSTQSGTGHFLLLLCICCLFFSYSSKMSDLTQMMVKCWWRINVIMPPVTALLFAFTFIQTDANSFQGVVSSRQCGALDLLSEPRFAALHSPLWKRD